MMGLTEQIWLLGAPFSSSGSGPEWAAPYQPYLLCFPKEKNMFQKRVFWGDLGVGQ